MDELTIFLAMSKAPGREAHKKERCRLAFEDFCHLSQWSGLYDSFDHWPGMLVQSKILKER